MTYEIRENYYALYLASVKQLIPEQAFARLDGGTAPDDPYKASRRGYKVCRRCMEQLPVGQFYNKKNVKCKPCARQEARERLLRGREEASDG